MTLTFELDLDGDKVNRRAKYLGNYHLVQKSSVWTHRKLDQLLYLVAWHNGKHRSLAGELFLSCARPVADG